MRVPRAISWLAVGLLAAGGASAAGEPSLHVVSDRALPGVLSQTLDLRWASDSTLYLAAGSAGTFEVPLEPTAGQATPKIPGKKTPGGFEFNHRIGASARYLAVAGPIWAVTWRTPASPRRREEAFDEIQDVDVAGSRIVVLGERRDERSNWAPDGGIAWLGSLDKDLADLRAVLFDASGPGARTMGKCALLDLGAVRFLPDGKFLAVPGSQPGAYLYDSDGRLLRTLDTVALGLDTDCAAITEEQRLHLNVDFPARYTWINKRTVLEEILPLPQGPGLVLRTVTAGKVEWKLKVLRASGEVATYSIPLEASNLQARLHGDVRGNRIAFVMVGIQESRTALAPPARLILAEVPAQ